MVGRVCQFRHIWIKNITQKCHTEIRLVNIPDNLQYRKPLKISTPHESKPPPPHESKPPNAIHNVTSKYKPPPPKYKPPSPFPNIIIIEYEEKKRLITIILSSIHSLQKK